MLLILDRLGLSQRDTADNAIEQGTYSGRRRPSKKKAKRKTSRRRQKASAGETAAGGRIGYSAAALHLYIALLFCNSTTSNRPYFPHPGSRRRPSLPKTGRKIEVSGMFIPKWLKNIGTALWCQNAHYCHQNGRFIPIRPFDPMAFTTRDGCQPRKGAPRPEAAAPLPSKWRKTVS